MKKIMFVCHGNICRSPMAEFILKDMLEKNGMKDVFVSSCSTSTEEIFGGRGNPIYPPARAELSKRNVPFDKSKRAVRLKKSDYEKYDLFVAMDDNNIRNIKRIFLTDSEKKVTKLLDFEGGRDVSDPWYTRNFSQCFDDIHRGCEHLIKQLKEN